MEIDDIAAGWSEYVYVWVRPANGQTWAQMHRSSFGQVNKRDWRPAMVTGFSDEGDRQSYDTGADPRRVTLIGDACGYDVHHFEFGDLILGPDHAMDAAPAAAPIKMLSI